MDAGKPSQLLGLFVPGASSLGKADVRFKGLSAPLRGSTTKSNTKRPQIRVHILSGEL